MKRSLFAVFSVLALAFPMEGQTSFQRGDVVVSAYEDVLGDDGTPISVQSNLRVYGNDGAYKRELVSPDGVYGEPFVLRRIVFFGSREAIERVATDGTRLEPFTTNVANVNYLSPGPTGGILAVNNSGEIYQFAADGTLIRFRDSMQNLPAFGGIDLASDGCTAYYGLA